MGILEPELTPYLEQLRGLPFVTEAELTHRPPAPPFETVLHLRTQRRLHELLVVVTRTHLTRPLVDGILGQAAQFPDRPWILFAPHIGRPLGQYLATHEVNYVDEIGNCRLQLEQDHIAWIEGRRPTARKQRGRGVGKAGYQVMFAILAQPDLLDEPVRAIAQAAGVSKNTAATTVARLTEEGLVGRGRTRRQVLARQTILDRWLTGYANTVRPRLLVGTFRTRDTDPEALENRIQTVLHDAKPWAWGGGAAAMRLTGFYRGPETVLHAAAWQKEDAIRLQAVRADDGPLIVLGVPGEVAFRGAVPRTVHPLLVYTELLTAGGERASETAEEIRSKYLQI